MSADGLLLVLLYYRQIWESRMLLCESAAMLLIITLYIGLQITSALNAAMYMSATPVWFLLLIVLFSETRFRHVTGWALSSVRSAC
ncbi:hypothetical protein SB6413_04557 [Klebsiella pasteurii]|nr:hypothetical protein SB6413_04557 [Klebsiella pasteurii]